MPALAGKTVWLTRPLFQVEALRKTLEESGCRVVHLPMFDIRPLPETQGMRDTVLNLDRFELVFFISTNAAKLGLDYFLHYQAQLPVGQQYFAVGPTTAEVLESEGLIVHFPRERMSSEALLALPELEHITGKHALICRGRGGRETLAAGLSDKGASVTYLELYERAVPDYEASYLRELSARPADAIVVSSSEALANLVKTFEGVWTGLSDANLLVSSQRIHDDAREAGFRHVLTMTGASDPCIMQALDSLFPAS